MCLAAVLPSTSIASSAADPASAERSHEPVYVDETDILYLESYPVQVQLVVRGSLPTPCHEPIWKVDTGPDAVEVRLWSESDPQAFCATVLDPFELAIPLGSYESADLGVWLNEELVGRIEIGDTSTGGESALTGAGWWFGLCLGHCSAELGVEGTALVLSGHDNGSSDPLYVNRGELTPEGQGVVAAALAALDGVVLEETYGCPDCADGGGAHLSLRRGDVVTQHVMEFGGPPDELAELHDLTMSMMTALQHCRSDELVTVSEDCSAYEGR